MPRLRRILPAAALIALLLSQEPAALALEDVRPPQGVVGAIAIVTRAGGPIVALEHAELSRLALGQQKTLSDGTPVRFADLAPGPVRERFYRRVAQRNPAQMRAYWSRIVFTGRGSPPPAARSGQQLREWLAKDASLIGYLPYEQLTPADDATLRVLQVLE